MTGPSHAIRRSVARAARDFDAPALLDVLALLGYRESDVTFRGRVGWTSCANVLEACELTDDEAVVSTNIGLLGPQGPLPSFFLEALEALQDPTLLDLIGVLDHHALALRFASLYPERDARLAGGTAWEETKRSVTRALGLASPSTLHWLFEQVFPELAVTVRRGRAHRRVLAQDARLGTLRLSVAALGGDAELPTGGIEVTLIADVPSPDRSWPAEAARRMREQILPTLAGLELELTVRLRLLEPAHHLRLAIDGVGDATLGGDAGERDLTAERLLLVCSGPISELHFPQP
jgi:hypothetical protein